MHLRLDKRSSLWMLDITVSTATRVPQMLPFIPSCARIMLPDTRCKVHWPISNFRQKLAESGTLQRAFCRHKYEYYVYLDNASFSLPDLDLAHVFSLLHLSGFYEKTVSIDMQANLHLVLAILALGSLRV